MKRSIILSIALVGSLMFLPSSCVKEITGDDPLGLAGNPIVFSAATSYDNGRETKAEYSGYFYGSPKTERIDWMENDPITIFYNSNSGDYKVTTEITPNNKKSFASIELDGTGDGLVWDEGSSHVFFAAYPSTYSYSDPLTYELVEGESLSSSGVLSGHIPYHQKVDPDKYITIDGQVKYQPDTKHYGFMFDYLSLDSPESNVVLPFKPAFTTFEFKLKRRSTDADRKVSYILLKSEEVMMQGDEYDISIKDFAWPTLSGNFEFSIPNHSDSDGNPVLPGTVPPMDYNVTWNSPLSPSSYETNGGISVTYGGSSIEIDFSDFPGGGVSIPADSYLDFSVLCLPVDQSHIELQFFYADDVNITPGSTLQLKDSDGDWYTFTGGKKYIITNDGVPGDRWEYYIGDLVGVTVGPPGGSGNFGIGFKSYKTNGRVTEPVPYRLRFWTPDGGWSWNPPEWLEMDVDYTGSVAGLDLSVVFPPQANSAPQTQHHPILADDSRTKTDFDLSTYNVATGTEGINRTTANCYVVRGSGTYKLPLVYGNGVVNGSINESAFHAKYTASDPTYISDNMVEYLGHFKDHLDQNITTPYIVEQQSGKTLSAALIWTDVDGLVTDVALSGSGRDTYLTFSVPAETIDQGNALVAVLADGKIAWSWHIWVTEDMGSPELGFNGIYFSPLNLGWVEGKHFKYEERYCYVFARQDESGLSTYDQQGYTLLWQTGDEFHSGPTNPFYQWGRKDPLWQADGSIPEGSEYNEFPGFKVYYPGPGIDLSAIKVDGAVSLGTAIQNPFTFYHKNGTSNTVASTWCTTNQLNKWNSVYAGERYQDYHDPVTKTIYDPSPVGYVLPNHDVFKDLSTSVLIWDSEKRGRYYVNNPNLFFHAAGYFVDRGFLSEYAKTANYWSAIPVTNWSDWLYWGLGISFNDSSVSGWQLLHRRATGLSVRPVLEE